MTGPTVEDWTADSAALRWARLRGEAMAVLEIWDYLDDPAEEVRKLEARRDELLETEGIPSEREWLRGEG